MLSCVQDFLSKAVLNISGTFAASENRLTNNNTARNTPRSSFFDAMNRIPIRTPRASFLDFRKIGSKNTVDRIVSEGETESMQRDLMTIISIAQDMVETNPDLNEYISHTAANEGLLVFTKNRDQNSNLSANVREEICSIIGTSFVADISNGINRNEEHRLGGNAVSQVSSFDLPRNSHSLYSLVIAIHFVDIASVLDSY